MAAVEAESRAGFCVGLVTLRAAQTVLALRLRLMRLIPARLELNKTVA
jgi:hypothetical protein